MFTGIIRATEQIKLLKTYHSGDNKDGSLFVEVGLPKGWKLKEGQSICINGICSTVCGVFKEGFKVEYMPETINKTTVLEWSAGYVVNLEKSLKLSDFVDGHLVSGHIDNTGKIVHIDKKGDSKVFTIKITKDLIKYIVPKGSVALDGISLTVVDVIKDCFTVSLVEYTLKNTNFGGKKVGELINVEIDTIAKYVYNFLKSNIYKDYAKKRK